MRALRRISAAIIGAVFFLGGVFKLMDPVGTGLIVEEYFKFFHLLFLLPAAKVAGAALALAEVTVGAALMTDVKHRITGIVSGAFIAFFTLITFLLWIFNPAMDCGCFGEVVHLTHAQSLLKNVVLAGLWALSFIPLTVPYTAKKAKYVGFGIAVLSCVVFLVYSWRSIPLMDYTPFAPGSEIMRPDDEFSADAPMLSFCDADGVYADSLLFGAGIVAASLYDFDKVCAEDAEALNTFMESVSAAGLQPLILAAAAPEDIASGGLFPSENVRYADRRTLMTLNRSNGGVTYLVDGQVVSKWPAKDLPDGGTLEWLASTDSMEVQMEQTSKPRMKMQAFLLYVFAVMLLI